ncbi:DUF6364 family protein [Nocardiopsis sediminis]|uniref:DUF6364 family protein n=1 Tax=Nocardiopsis sediminis TaxID=1778267 RepID=A0ABV8FQM1_9ACTN
MATRNVTIQLDEELVREAKILAAEEGTSVSAMVARNLRDRIAARSRRNQAMLAALESMNEAAGSGRQAPHWTRGELYDR